MKTIVIADLHFVHKNILSYDNRPFKDIETHDNFIINKWNDTVGYDDEVWVLGDVSWHSSTKTIEYLKLLNGIKHLIIGNHDKKLLRNRDFQTQFQSIQDYKELQITKPDGQGSELLVLSHYPIPCFNRHYYGAYHFYGHVQDSYEWNMMEHLRRQFEDLYTQPCNMIKRSYQNSNNDCKQYQSDIKRVLFSVIGKWHSFIVFRLTVLFRSNHFMFRIRHCHLKIFNGST